MEPPKPNNLFKIILTLIKNLSINLEEWNWKKSIKEFFTTDLKNKSIVLGFTLFFFYYVSSQNIQEKTLFIPLKIIKSEELTFANEIPKNITLSISGTRDNLFDLNINQLVSEIDISSIKKEGETKAYPQIKGLPQGIQILGISPNEIDIELSSLHTKIIKIEPEFLGKVASGYLLKEYTISPKRLKISAPLDILEDLTTLKTEPIDIKGIKSNKEIEVGLNKNIHPNIEIDHSKKFKINLIVNPRFIKKNQNGYFTINVDNLASNLTIKNNLELLINKINYKLDNTLKESIVWEEEDIFYINAKSIKAPGTYILPIKYKKNFEKAKIISIEPKTIEIIIDLVE